MRKQRGRRGGMAAAETKRNETAEPQQHVFWGMILVFWGILFSIFLFWCDFDVVGQD